MSTWWMKLGGNLTPGHDTLLVSMVARDFVTAQSQGGEKKQMWVGWQQGIKGEENFCEGVHGGPPRRI